MSRVESKPRRGPRRSLDVEQVVDAAVAVVDEGGPDALSVRAVAGRLGLNPNALYTYVPSRAALEKVVVERVLGESDRGLLAGAKERWRERIASYAGSLRAALLTHPGVARLLMTAPMDGPNALQVGEGLMGALVDAGLSHDDAGRASYSIMVQVLGAVALEVAETDGRPPLAPEADRVAGRREALTGVDAECWPHTAAAIDVMAQWISTEQFDWSLARLLDGLAGAAAGVRRTGRDRAP
jgi:AcrR family transcriptional regulator